MERCGFGDGDGEFELLTVGERPAIRGECDVATAAKIEAWLASFDLQPLEVDLSQVTFFDSASLRTFLNAKRRNRYLRIVNPSHAVRCVLEITGTVEYLVDGRDIFG